MGRSGTLPSGTLPVSFSSPSENSQDMVRTCRKPGVQVDLFNGEPPASRPAWRVIEAARNQHLTGELALPSNPPTNVYLINGEVYFAERTTDGGIGVRLLVEGVITRKQMSKGSVMVSGAEHLGRLFERDDSIDRHAVELCVELMTDDVLTSVSKETVDSYMMTLYKRHTSGIDRWLPNQSTADAPPVNEDQREAAFSDLAPPPSVNGTAVAPAPVLAPVAQVSVAQAAAVAPPVAQAPVAPAPVLTATPQPTRIPERLELDSWPTHTAEPAGVTRLATTPPAASYPATSMPTAASMPTSTATATATAATDSSVPSSFADEVAAAVRRALAAIDSVLTPADVQPKSPPRPM